MCVCICKRASMSSHSKTFYEDLPGMFISRFSIRKMIFFLRKINLGFDSGTLNYSFCSFFDYLKPENQICGESLTRE